MLGAILLLLSLYKLPDAYAHYSTPYPKSLDPRIINGTLARIEETPYQVYIKIGKINFCGGSIIDNNHILTAAHCLFHEIHHQEVDAKSIRIIAGTNDKTRILDTTQIIRAASYNIHENYNYEELSPKYDLAVIKVKCPLEFNDNVKPIELAKEDPKKGLYCTVSGWGIMQEGSTNYSPNELYHVKLRSLSRETCQELPNSIDLGEDVLCFLEKGKDACQGDSGGPLVCEPNILSGIVSMGKGCAESYSPGLYVSVAYHREWINSQIKKTAKKIK